MGQIERTQTSTVVNRTRGDEKSPNRDICSGDNCVSGDFPSLPLMPLGQEVWGQLTDRVMDVKRIFFSSS